MDKANTIEFLNIKLQQYDWDNDNLEYGKGLIESDIAHPDFPAEFPGIDQDSKQPRHHQVVKASKRETRSASMPCNKTHH